MPGIYTPIPTAADLVLSVRSQIPDRAPDDDPALDGNAFRVDTLLRWVNDAGRLIALAAPIVQDWFGFPTEEGQDVYELPSYLTSVEQAWYNLLPLMRAPEGDSIFTSKISGRSWWMGSHSVHARPRLHVWPAPSESGATTTLNGALADTATAITLTSTTNFQQFGYAVIDPGTETEELVRYATVDGAANQLKNVLRGQGATTAPASWASGKTIRECNLFGKAFRLPRPLKKVTDPLEIPQGLWPLVELYVLSKVRESEQDHQTSLQLFNTFNQIKEQLVDKSQLKGLRQGLQVKIGPIYPNLFRGRIFIP
jgi:hypothetical protein